MKFLNTLSSSVNLYIKNPKIVIPAIFALIILYLFSLSSSIFTSFQLNKTISISLFIIMIIFSIFIISLVILGFTSLSISIVKKSRLDLKKDLRKLYLIFFSTIVIFIASGILRIISI